MKTVLTLANQTAQIWEISFYEINYVKLILGTLIHHYSASTIQLLYLPVRDLEDDHTHKLPSIFLSMAKQLVLEIQKEVQFRAEE